jgi:hypothetical protein
MVTPRTGRPVGRPKRPDSAGPGRAIYVSAATFARLEAIAAELAAANGTTFAPGRAVDYILSKWPPPKPKNKGK